MMRDLVETAFDVALDNPWIRQPAPSIVLIAFLRQGGSTEVLQSGVAVSSGPKPVGHMPKLRFEDRLQQDFDRALNNAIFDRGNAQGSELSWFSGLGDENAFGRTGPICAGAQLDLKSFQKALLTRFGADAPHGHPIDPGGTCASIGRHAPPGAAKRADVGQPTPHISPLVVRIFLTPLIEFALNAEYPSLIGLSIHVHGSFLRHTSLSSSCFPSPCAWLSHALTTTKAPSSASSVSGRRG